MKLTLSQKVPSWMRIVTVCALVIVTTVLVSAQLADTVVGSPVAVSPERIVQLLDQEETLNLSMEFGFDPMIVQVTRKLAADAIRTRSCACKTWRFVKTEKDLTYLVLSIVAIESRGDYKAFNPAGPAYGLTQFVMSTARQYDKSITDKDLFTIPKHMALAMTHFVDLLERYKGNASLAVWAWNRGSGGVDRSVALGESTDSAYAKMVFTQAAMRNAQ